MVRILYLCPGIGQTPRGGLRRLYHHVDILNEAGLDSFIVHARRGGRLGWFENDTPILYAPLRTRPDDILVIPEVFRERLYTIAPGTSRVSLNLNCFTWTPTNAEMHDSSVIATLTNSVYSLELLQRVVPGHRTMLIRHGIDQQVWYPDFKRKRRKISYMPSKHRLLGRQLSTILSNELADDWELFAIDALTEQEVARHLRESELFLSLSRLEGFGRPPVEAMAAGASVIGFSGVAGREYFDATCALEIPEGAVLDFSAAVMDWVETYDRDLARLRIQQVADAQRVCSMYSLRGERELLTASFSDVLNRTRTTSAIRPSLLWPTDIEPAASFVRRGRAHLRRAVHRANP